MTDEEKAQVASLIARLDQRCACMCDEDGEIVSQCLAHIDLRAEAVKTEREACAKIADESAAADRRKGEVLAKAGALDAGDNSYEDFAVTAEVIASRIRKRTS